MKRFGAAACALILAFAALFTLHASAESAASKVDMYCTVNNDGDCLVSMTVTLRMEASDEGLTFPLPYSASIFTESMDAWMAAPMPMMLSSARPKRRESSGIR